MNVLITERYIYGFNSLTLLEKVLLHSKLTKFITTILFFEFSSYFYGIFFNAPFPFYLLAI